MIVKWKCASTKNEPCAVGSTGTSETKTPEMPPNRKLTNSAVANSIGTVNRIFACQNVPIATR